MHREGILDARMILKRELKKEATLVYFKILSLSDGLRADRPGFDCRQCKSVLHNVQSDFDFHLAFYLVDAVGSFLVG
jgi:hypothetical protein